jgi:hypothetical protein
MTLVFTDDTSKQLGKSEKEWDGRTDSYVFAKDE